VLTYPHDQNPPSQRGEPWNLVVVVVVVVVVGGGGVVVVVLVSNGDWRRGGIQISTTIAPRVAISTTL